MPDIVLTTINARYVHAALGLRYLAANMGELQPHTRIPFKTPQPRPPASTRIVARLVRSSTRLHATEVSTSTSIPAAASGRGPSEQIVALGYAGWAPGQLEDEIKQNAWLTVPADASVIFELPPGQRLKAVMRHLGIDLAMLSEAAGHA